METVLESKSFVDIIQEQLSSGALQLPLFHPIALKLQEVLKNTDFTTEQVTSLIIQDQALTSQILRLANSAFFSGLSKVATIREAVIRLGAEQIASVAMTATQEDSYRIQTPELERITKQLWRHALGCALGSRWLAERAGFKNLAQEAFVGGLLHDIGKLLILKVMEKIALDEKSPVKFSAELAMEIMDSMHCESGYNLMRQWNLPDSYAIIARDHHKEQCDPSNILLATVHLVDNVCRKIGLGLQYDPATMLAATFEAQVLGVKEIMLAELEIMIEDAMGVPADKVLEASN